MGPHIYLHVSDVLPLNTYRRVQYRRVAQVWGLRLRERGE